MRYAFRIAGAVIAGILVGTVWAEANSHYSSRSYAYQTEVQEDSSEYYRNIDGNLVHRPEFSAQQPSGATAQCADGSYSFSQHRRGTCNYHGGVLHWLN